MGVILLADDSPHAQRMGERILSEEGFSVVSLADGETVALRLAEVDPDLVIADAFLPRRSGFDLCRHIKTYHRHVRVILTAGVLEAFDEGAARRAGCDAILKKPFEASVIMQTIRPLIHDARMARGLFAEAVQALQPAQGEEPAPTPKAPDPEKVQAAIAAAVQAAVPALVRDITEKVLVALGH